MKKFAVLFISLALLLGLCACTSSNDTPATSPGTLSVEPTQGTTSAPTAEPTAETTPEPTPESTLGLLPPGEVVASGDCGENLTWTLDSFGLLTISGTGSMEDYKTELAPWFGSPLVIIIESGATSIGNGAFKQCEMLFSVTIPDSVTSIGPGAFMECYFLPSVTIPNGVTSIGTRAFFECYSLTEVILPDSVTSIDIQTFAKCTGLTSVTIPNSVTSIEQGAFAGCDNLTDIFYGGSEAQWSQIDISVNNDPLLDATIHYNS